MSELTGTQRTKPELMVLFRDGQPANSVTAQDMRDFVESVPSLVGPSGRSSIVVNTDYMFTSTPGGTLTGGIANAVAVTPVPAGVSGAAVDQYVYISGGVGDAEAVLIEGGTAESGGETGTLTFTPANNHSGEWTITSATGGIQEAINYASETGVGTVEIAAGEYTVSPITVVPNMTVQGSGWGTKLTPRSSSGRVFSLVNSSFSNPYDGTGQARVKFRDMVVSAGAHGADSAVGFYFWGQTFILIENVLFDDINYGVFLDKCFFCKITNCHGQDDTSLFVGSTTDTEAFFRSADIRITNYSYKYSTVPEVITSGRKLIHLQGAICVRITDCSLADMNFRGYPISVEWGCEDVMITNVNMLRGINNIQTIEATVGTTTMSPVSVSVIGGACAGYGARAIYFKNGFLLLADGVDLTGVISGTGMEVAAVEVDDCYGVTINACRFMLTLDGNSIKVNAGAADVTITSNFFRQLTTDADVSILGAVSGLVIANNLHSPASVGTIFLASANTLAEQIVHGNMGIDDVGAQAVLAATTIGFYGSVIAIDGAATITNILPPAYFTDSILVAPVVGSTWLMSALGNIANPPATHPGIPFYMKYVENAISGPKWYVIGLAGIVA